MNLHGIVSGAIGLVNPNVYCTIRMSVGYTTAPDGTQQPKYTVFANVPCQIQSLTYDDLQQVDATNQQGVIKTVYLNGNWSAINRPQQQGGDLLTMSDGTVWLVTQVLESWPDWTKLLVTLQNRK